MPGAGTTAAVLLAAVFVLAAAAKLRRPRTTQVAFAGLGLPAPAALARLVPAAELALAAALVARPRWGGLLALGALGGFTAVLARALGAGADVRCGCFGAGDGRRVSWVEPVRNALLALAAGAALAAPRPVVPALAEVVAVTTAALAALVVLALCELRVGVGAVWDNRLAGEAAPGGGPA